MIIFSYLNNMYVVTENGKEMIIHCYSVLMNSSLNMLNTHTMLNEWIHYVVKLSGPHLFLMFLKFKKFKLFITQKFNY